MSIISGHKLNKIVFKLIFVKIALKCDIQPSKIFIEDDKIPNINIIAVEVFRFPLVYAFRYKINTELNGKIKSGFELMAQAQRHQSKLGTLRLHIITNIRFAKNMIMDLNNWANGYTFWNLLLNQNGGPRHAGGTPYPRSNIITADINIGEITFNPPHYTFGQFSRFIKPGAMRIACTSNSDDYIATAFVNPDGKIAVVILNLKDTEQILQLWVEGKALKLKSPAEAVITMIL